MGVTESRLCFESGGEKCAADLYLPDGREGQLPCIVMAQGFSGTKDSFGMPETAGRFAAEGFAALTFDYRNFGASEGKLRQVVNFRKQREDYHAAIRFARGLDRIKPDKVAIWGSSVAGSNVLHVAAEDPSVAAVIALVPFIDVVKSTDSGKQSARVERKLLFAAVRDTVHGLLGLPPYLVPAIGNPGEFASMTEPDAKPVAAAVAEGTNWRNAFAPRVAFSMPRFGERAAARLNMPLLLCIAEHDVQASPTFAASIADKAPKGEARMYPVGHFGLYPPGEARDQAISDQLEFLKRCLP